MVKIWAIYMCLVCFFFQMLSERTDFKLATLICVLQIYELPLNIYKLSNRLERSDRHKTKDRNPSKYCKISVFIHSMWKNSQK